MAETPAVCEHLHLPLQSGSDAVLKAMRRGYTASRYLERLAAARSAIDELAVTTDLIVGFPGETDEDAERTLEVVAEARFDSAYTFVFSPRPGTRAAAMTDRFIPPDVVAERFEQLKLVLERSALTRHEDRVGREEDVLVEGVSKRDPGVLSARTRQGKLVHFEAPSAAKPSAGKPPAANPPAGSYARVRVTGAAPHFLRGEFLTLTALPRHRVRIPVRSGGRALDGTSGDISSSLVGVGPGERTVAG
jgi:tRNA-2-methylthio-N6-dimethylallyladenosine synthase